MFLSVHKNGFTTHSPHLIITNHAPRVDRCIRPGSEPCLQRSREHSQLEAFMNIPVFIDFEASSLDLVASYPIEVGVCMADGTLHDWLIKPHVIWRDWSEKSQQIHGIAPEVLQREGLPISQVTHELNELLHGMTVYCDAWTFDCFWLHRLFKSIRRKPEFQIDSIAVLLNPRQIPRWQGTRNEVVRDMNIQTHRAANDARILHETWKRVQSLKG